VANIVDIEIRTDYSGVGITKAMADALALKRLIQSIGTVDVFAGNIDGTLTKIKSRMSALKIADLLDINIPPGMIDAQLMLLKRKIEQHGLADLLDVNVNTSQVGQQISTIENEFKSTALSLVVNPGVGSGMTADVTNAIAVAAGQGLAIGLGNRAPVAALGRAIATTVAGATALGLAAGMGAGGAGSHTFVGAPGGGGGGGGGGRGNAAGGGATFAFFGAGTIGAVSAVHLAIDGMIEAIVAVGLAAAAAAIGIASMVPAAQDVYLHLQSVNTVANTLGVNIRPLSGQFSKIAQAMAPQTVEAYGGALNAVSRNTGVFSRTASQVVTIFDDWIAKIDIWTKSQGGFGALLNHGIGYLTQFGHIIGTVGLALGNLLKADPGIAHFLLDIVQAAADVLLALTKLPHPIVEFGLALHGALIWGAAFVDVFGLRVVRALGFLNDAQFKSAQSALKFRNILGTLFGTPWGWAAIGAAAFGYLAYKGTQADKATKDFVANLQNGLSNLTASQAIQQISIDIGQLNQRMSTTTMSSISRGWDSFGNTINRVANSIGAAGSEFAKAFSIGHPASFTGFFADIGRGVNDFVTQTGSAANQYKNDQALMSGAVNKFLGDQRNLFTEIGNLTGAQGKWNTYAQKGVTGTGQLGVSLTHASSGGFTFAQALGVMDMAGVRAGDSVQLMEQKVQNLIRGYTNLTAKGPMLNNAINAVTFSTELQNTQARNLNNAWDTFLSTISGGISGEVSFSQSLITMDRAAKINTSSLGLLSNRQLTLKQNFVSTAQAANNQMDNLTTLAAAAGGGSKATNELQRANKDLVASMLPAAKGSSQLTTVLYALAQRGGYRGADSFKALSEWVGNVHHPMQNLDGIVTTLTKHAGNLTTDVRNLSVALGTTLNNAMATAIVAATGGTKWMSALYAAVKTTGLNSKTTATDAQHLANQFFSLTGNTKDAEAEFVTFAERGLHLTKDQATDLWQRVLPGLQGQIDRMHGKNIPITMVASAHGQVAAFSQGLTAKEHALLKFSQEGSVVSGGTPGRDSVLIAATPGEGIVPTWAMPTIQPIGAAMGIPGFAGGGIAGDISGRGIGNIPSGPPWMAGAGAQFSKSAELMWAHAAIKQFQSSAKAAAAMNFGAGKGGLGRASLSAIENYWMQAGGPGGYIAHIAAAITGAESGFNPRAVQAGQPYATTGWGLWQITPGNSEPQAGINGQLLDPFRNALAAVSKFDQAGHSFSPWTTYVDGAYQAFMDNGGWLRPGWNPPMYNGTGNPEYIGSRAGGTQKLQLEWVGPRGTLEAAIVDAVMKHVRVKGGGDVQFALGG
jgi:hypothetical protein